MQSLRLTVVRRSSSMMPILMVLRGQPKQFLDAVEQFAGEGDLVRAVHLGLDDIDRAGAAVRGRDLRLEVVQRDQAGDHGIQEAFAEFRRPSGQARRR